MPFSVALAQITGQPFETADNRQLTVDVAERELSSGVSLIVLPELIVSGYVMDREKLRKTAEPLDGPTVDAWTRTARAHGALIAGGFCERDGDTLFNTAVLVDGNGPVLHYRKLHPFNTEKEIFAPGNRGLPIVRTDLGVVGLCVCYDLRFPEVARALALQGADLIAVPTAWVRGFDNLDWDRDGYCPQARNAAMQANLNQVFLACASQVGTVGDVEFLGSSLLVDPYGEVRLGPLPGDSEAVAHVEIDLKDTAGARHRSPLISPRDDRRTDVYGIWLDGERL